MRTQHRHHYHRLLLPSKRSIAFFFFVRFCYICNCIFFDVVPLFLGHNATFRRSLIIIPVLFASSFNPKILKLFIKFSFYLLIVRKCASVALCCCSYVFLLLHSSFSPYTVIIIYLSTTPEIFFLNAYLLLFFILYC